MDIKTQIIIEELDKQDLSRKDLAELMHVTPSLITTYLNGEKAPDDFYKRAADALNSIRLKLLIYGDTTDTIYFDRVRIDMFVTMKRLKKECEELIEVIDQAFNTQLENVMSVEDCDREQREVIYNVLEQSKDVNHCCEHFDVATHDIGFDLEERDRKCFIKYLDKGYISATTTRKDTNRAMASVL